MLTRLQKQHGKGWWRERKVYDYRLNTTINYQQQHYINFTSNDYLNLNSHALIKQALQQGIDQYGWGSGSSSLITGIAKATQRLEEIFSEFIGREKSLLFTSGYQANLAVLTTFGEKNKILLADKYCHASIIDGMRLASAKYFRFKHNDLLHAEYFLKKFNREVFLISESVFSMEGDISAVENLVELTKLYTAKLIVDDAHGIGVLGKTGRGISESVGINSKDIFSLITPLGKALGGMGALVSGDANMIEHLIQFARPYAYTTALPPAISLATVAALKIIEQENWRVEKLQWLIKYFIKQAISLGIPLISYELTPIKVIPIHDSRRAEEIKKYLFAYGLVVASIRPPTVPISQDRLRITLNCLHTENDIQNLLTLIAGYLYEHKHK